LPDTKRHVTADIDPEFLVSGSMCAEHQQLTMILGHFA
jgi:hypothetical protein